MTSVPKEVKLMLVMEMIHRKNMKEDASDDGADDKTKRLTIHHAVAEDISDHMNEFSNS